MNELKERLMEKVGLDDEKTAKVIETVTAFIKEKLPENLQGMVDGILSGDGDGDGDGGNPLDAVKGFFGGD